MLEQGTAGALATPALVERGKNALYVEWFFENSGSGIF